MAWMRSCNLIAISPSPLARPADVAGPRLSVTGAFNVESQPLAFPDVVWIDARRLQRSDVEKHIRTAGVVCDETVATAFHIFKVLVAIALDFPSPSRPRISTSAKEGHALNSVAPLATILNDVLTFSVGGAFLKLHCL